MKSIVLPLLSLSLAAPAFSDVVHADDVIIEGGLCVGGVDCVNGEIFVGEDIKIKSTNPEILFEDTSSGSNNAWSLDGDDDDAGRFNSFSINNRTANTIPFAIAPTAPSSALFISDDGKIGLGTILPQNDLHIVGPMVPQLRFEQSSPPYTWDIGAGTDNFFVQDVTAGTTPLAIEDAAPTNSFRMASNGDVGLGIFSPEEKLHIQTTADNTDAFALLDAAGAGSDAALLLRQNGITPTTWEIRNQQSSGRLNIGIAGGNTPLKIDDLANHHLLRLGANGNHDAIYVLGRLFVNYRQLRVPDYVFEDNYALRSLADVRSFIDTNSRLPEVPSASDIARDGVDMTEMQMVLLKKIEELTLYTLEQEAELAQLRGLKTEMAQIKAMLAER